MARQRGIYSFGNFRNPCPALAVTLAKACRPMWKSATTFGLCALRTRLACYCVSPAQRS